MIVLGQVGNAIVFRWLLFWVVSKHDKYLGLFKYQFW